MSFVDNLPVLSGIDLEYVLGGKLVLVRCWRNEPVAVAFMVDNTPKNAQMLDEYADYLCRLYNEICGEPWTTFVAMEVCL